MKISEKQIFRLMDYCRGYLHILLELEKYNIEGFDQSVKDEVLELLRIIKNQQSEELIELDDKLLAACCSAHAGSYEECK